MIHQNQIICVGSETDPEVYGHKAYWLSWLYNKGYSVPEAVYIPFIDPLEKKHEIKVEQIKDTIISKISSISDNGNSRLAVRSSSNLEDSEKKSFAGYFKTIYSNPDIDELSKNVLSVIDGIEHNFGDLEVKVGVIIQRLIEAKYSGTVFSSDPVSKSKLSAKLSYNNGMGDSLMDGSIAGNDILYNYDDGILSANSSNFNDTFAVKIFNIAKSIEEDLGFPVDLEWCIDEEHRLYLLQCRPITGIFSDNTSLINVTYNNLKKIPETISRQSKVKLRIKASKDSVPISRGYIISVNSGNRLSENVQLPDNEKIEKCSIVLIEPELFRDKIYRKFADNNTLDINTTLKYASEAVLSEYWTATFFIQEFYPIEYTGQLKQISDNAFLIEIIRGSMIQKGSIPPSSYFVDKNGTIKSKNEIIQTSEYTLLEGNLAGSNTSKTLKISAYLIRDILIKFKPLITQKNIYEFGISKINNGFFPFLTDVIEENSIIALSETDVNESIICKGRIEGVFKVIDIDSLNKDECEMHLYDNYRATEKNYSRTVYYCELPSIKLFDLVVNSDPGKIGFIFEKGSLLSHLPTILREKSIPSMFCKLNISEFKDKMVRFDTTTKNVQILNSKNYGSSSL